MLTLMFTVELRLLPLLHSLYQYLCGGTTCSILGIVRTPRFHCDNLMDCFWDVISFVNYSTYLTWDGVPSLTNLSVKSLVRGSVYTALKFLTLIAILIFSRGGIPRYRYDFLTKLGWVKFLSLVLAVFLSAVLVTYLL